MNSDDNKLTFYFKFPEGEKKFKLCTVDFKNQINAAFKNKLVTAVTFLLSGACDFLTVEYDKCESLQDVLANEGLYEIGYEDGIATPMFDFVEQVDDLYESRKPTSYLKDCKEQNATLLLTKIQYYNESASSYIDLTYDKLQSASLLQNTVSTLSGVELFSNRNHEHMTIVTFFDFKFFGDVSKFTEKKSSSNANSNSNTPKYNMIYNPSSRSNRLYIIGFFNFANTTKDAQTSGFKFKSVNEKFHTSLGILLPLKSQQTLEEIFKDYTLGINNTICYIDAKKDNSTQVQFPLKMCDSASRFDAVSGLACVESDDGVVDIISKHQMFMKYLGFIGETNTWHISHLSSVGKTLKRKLAETDLDRGCADKQTDSVLHNSIVDYNLITDTESINMLDFGLDSVRKLPLNDFLNTSSMFKNLFELTSYAKNLKFSKSRDTHDADVAEFDRFVSKNLRQFQINQLHNKFVGKKIPCLLEIEVPAINTTTNRAKMEVSHIYFLSDSL